jgi:hypothetical protein
VYAKHTTVLLALLAFGLFISPAHAQSVGSREYPIKAAFLYNFLKYIDFPSTNTGNTVVIGIVGADPSDGAFDDLNGKTVNGKNLVIRHLGDHYDFSSVNVIFVPNSERDHNRQIMESCHAGMLTVGECPGFAHLGGVINFVPEGNRVRFEINPDAATKYELRISSQLLRLATIVH